MSDHNDNSEKTEKPTAQHLAKARREGNIVRSKEFSSIIILLSGWGGVTISGWYLAENLAYILFSSLSFDLQSITHMHDSGLDVYRKLSSLASVILPVAGIFFLTSLLAPLTIGGISSKLQKIKFDLTKINLNKGLKRVLSFSIFNEMIKTLLKITLLFIASMLFISCSLEFFLRIIKQPINHALNSSVSLILDYLLTMILCLIPVAAYDVLQQIRSHHKKLRMSKYEIKKEHKENEGDPQIKGRIRQIQQSLAQRRMMLNVPKADVIINNPTHISIALAYKKNQSAPQVVAKGRGELALRIRKIGMQHNIPMLEAPALARAIYKHCDLDEMIPSQLYMAVAQVLSWVYSIKHWHLHGGIKPQQPSNLPVPSNMDYQFRE